MGFGTVRESGSRNRAGTLQRRDYNLTNPDVLKAKLETIRARVPVVRGRGEEATKQALVLPMLDALGYDIWNPIEVAPE